MRLPSPARPVFAHLRRVGPGPATQSWDAQFRAIPDAAKIGEYMRRMSARPHHLGSPYDKDNAEWIAGLLKQWGWQVEIEQFHVLMPTPKTRRLEMTAPTRFVAALVEPPVAADPTSGQQAEQLPSYNAYSADGDVTGRLVYVNYGRPEDYEVLDRLGVSVKGADRHRALRRVVARHQAEGRRRAWRHRVPHLLRSERRRVLRRGGVPGGPDAEQGRRAARQRDGHARASRRPADAQRRRDARGIAPRRQGRADDHEDPGAAHLLRRCPAAACRDHRRLAPADWRGALPITYRIGPGEATVHLRSPSTGTSRLSTTSSPACRGRPPPTSGSCAAITTTRGSTAPRIR